MAQSLGFRQMSHRANSRAAPASSNDEDDLSAYASPGPNPDKDNDSSFSITSNILEFIEGKMTYLLNIPELTA